MHNSLHKPTLSHWPAAATGRRCYLTSQSKASLLNCLIDFHGVLPILWNHGILQHFSEFHGTQQAKEKRELH